MQARRGFEIVVDEHMAVAVAAQVERVDGMAEQAVGAGVVFEAGGQNHAIGIDTPAVR